MLPQPRVPVTGREIFLGEEDIIVTKTDLRGRITYANQVFLRMSHFHESEVLGAAHSIVRHPDMPRGVYKLLWDTLASGQEIFAYVKNLASTGDHYWVFAHATPTFDASGRITGYHSNRRRPNPAAVRKVEPLYAALRDVEAGHARAVDAAAASVARLSEILKERGVTYPELVFALWEGRE